MNLFGNRRRGDVPQAQRVSGPPSLPTRLLQDHVRALDVALGQLRRRWTGTVLTILVLGITLALPAGLQVLRTKLEISGYRLGQQTLQTTLFLKENVSDAEGQELAQSIARRPGIGKTRFISKKEALHEFETHGGGAALALLDKNPLPSSVVVSLDPRQSQSFVRALTQQLGGLPQVQTAQVDQKWIQRLYALIAVIKRVMLMVMGVLTVSVVIVIGNTVRLDVENRRDEIEVFKLVGATDAYVRRPFLYTGVCYGLGGALLAVGLVDMALLSLQESVRHLAELYDSGFIIQGLDFRTLLTLLGCGLVLGWLGAFWTVSRHLSRIQPR